MKYLKKYESHEEIKRICQKYGIRNYTINGDGTIDVNGYVNLYRRELTGELPLKFRSVSDSFNCDDNNLTSLAG